MMQEVGTVVELQGRHVAMVLCRKSTFCSGCAAMGLCQVGDDGRSMLVEAHNVLGADVGDRVRVVSRPGQFLLASFLLYVVPLLALIVGAAVGEIVGAFYGLGIDPNLLAAILGIAFMVGAFVIIRIGSRAIPRGTFMPEIAEILPSEECSEEQDGY
jgi:sigma-E factor negative regulatory protein RseC